MPHCTFLTMEGYNLSESEDNLLKPYLNKLGWEVSFAIWSRPEQWEKTDLAVIRSCWDYHKRLESFLAVLKLNQSKGCNILNTPELINWNSNKKYLNDLKERGISIVPTSFLDENNQVEEILSAFQLFGVERLVLKPTVSASADDTFLISEEYLVAQMPFFLSIMENRDFMVQPFVESIEKEGEYSLIFFNGFFSHAVQKLPQSEDFRVQEEFGGTSKRVDISNAWIKTAEKVIKELQEIPLYSRIDMVVGNDGNIWVMEAELIEPSLFLHLSPDGCMKFAASINDKFEKPDSESKHP